MTLGRTLIALGIIILALGVALTLGEKLPIRFGRLPGDIVIRGKNSALYFPLMTCLLVSAAQQKWMKMPPWRTHSCVPRSHSCERLDPFHTLVFAGVRTRHA